VVYAAAWYSRVGRVARAVLEFVSPEAHLWPFCQCSADHTVWPPTAANTAIDDVYSFLAELILLMPEAAHAGGGRVRQNQVRLLRRAQVNCHPVGEAVRPVAKDSGEMAPQPGHLGPHGENPARVWGWLRRTG
jgi:hypothetical protein